MYCRNCGNEIGEGVIFCPNCGQRVIDVSAGRQDNAAGQGVRYQYSNQSQNGNPEGMQNQYGGADWSAGEKGTSYSNADSYQNQYQQPVKSSPDGFAIASLVLSIISFFAFPLIGSILGIVFGNKSIRRNGMNTLARVGKILGIISLVLWCIIIVIYVVLIVVGIGLAGMGY